MLSSSLHPVLMVTVDPRVSAMVAADMKPMGMIFQAAERAGRAGTCSKLMPASRKAAAYTCCVDLVNLCVTHPLDGAELFLRCMRHRVNCVEAASDELLDVPGGNALCLERRPRACSRATAAL
jgi:hypothetical protein